MRFNFLAFNQLNSYKETAMRMPTACDEPARTQIHQRTLPRTSISVQIASPGVVRIYSTTVQRPSDEW